MTPRFHPREIFRSARWLDIPNDEVARRVAKARTWSTVSVRSAPWRSSSARIYGCATEALGFPCGGCEPRRVLHSTKDLRGEVLAGRYRIVRLLGVGALGSVYEARSEPFGRNVAIKVLNADLAHDEIIVERFKREARAASALSHPHVVDVIDFVTEPGKPPFLVMGLLVGQSLRDLFKQQARMPPERAAHIALQVLSALAAAHAAKIIHRDIKPDNIFLSSTATGADVVKVLDFGAAKLLGDTDGKPLTVTGMVIGTLSFMPPEQALGKHVDARTDLYALAATIYAAVSGRKPLDAPNPAQLLAAVVSHQPPSLTSLGIDVDPVFDAILAKALKKDPAERYANAREMARAFEKWLETRSPVPLPQSSDSFAITPGGVSLDAADEESHRRLRLPNVGSTLALGRYHLLEFLGAGGLGQVFRADDLVLGRQVALKVLRVARDPDETGLTTRGAAQILREARAAATIDHPNAVAVYDVSEYIGISYLVMELVAGRTLRGFIGDPYVTIERKVGWLIDIARALLAAHKKGIIHQDIKPENVMLRDDDVIKVLDFGIARRIFDNDSSLPGSETVERIPGTPAYMAPEQMHGEKGDALTDQFTWGVLAYELLTGGLPWLQHGGVLHVVHEILTRTPDPPSRRRSDVPKEIDQVVLKALSKRPGDRYASMDDVVRALARAWDEASSHPIDEVMASRPPPPKRRWGLMAAAAAAIAFVCGAAAPRDAELVDGDGSVSATVSSALPPDFGSAMSANPEAVAAYRAGMEAVRNAAGGTARKSFDRAIALDPSFAAAHLRKILATPDVTDGERANFLKAMQLRSSLGEHDRTLLQAIEPWVGVPQDTREVDRRLSALVATVSDADYLYQLCRFRVLGAKYTRAIDACRAARELDPTFAGAFWLEGQSQLLLGDTRAGSSALDTCLELSPKATSCLNDLLQVRSNQGNCQVAFDYAQRLVDLEPENGLWLEEIGALTYSTERPLSDVRATLERSCELLPVDQVSAARAKVRTNLAVLIGDLDDAARELEIWERAVAMSGREADHVEPLRIRTWFQRELGATGDIVPRARAFLASRAAWSPAPSGDADIDAQIALYQAGALTRRELETSREAWLARQQSSDLHRPRLGSGFRWITAFANAVVTKEDASQALAVLPTYLPLPFDRFRNPELDEPVGATLLRAERTEEAVPFLRQAANSCKAALYPFHHVWANLELGMALESRDRSASCAAYKEVLRRWGTAAKSVSAAKARARWQALGCR